MSSCQNYGAFLGTLNSRRRIILGTQKGTIILTTTHTVWRMSERNSGSMNTGEDLGVRKPSGLPQPDN